MAQNVKSLWAPELLLVVVHFSLPGTVALANSILVLITNKGAGMPTCQGQYIILQSLQHTVNVAQGSGGADRVPITLSQASRDK